MRKCLVYIYKMYRGPVVEAVQHRLWQSRLPGSIERLAELQPRSCPVLDRIGLLTFSWRADGNHGLVVKFVMGYQQSGLGMCGLSRKPESQLPGTKQSK